MVEPAELDLEIYQGASFYRQFVWKTGADKTPVDLTGASLRMQARYAPQAEDVLVDLTTENGLIVIEDVIGGVFALTIPADVTDTYQFPKAWYDLEVVLPGSGTHRLVAGRISVDLQVTR